jgi:site-specific DNA-methyltransferase (adenine-specific)
MFTASHESLIWARTSKRSRHHFDYSESKTGAWAADQLKRPGKQMRSVWQISAPKADEKRFGKHPTQKPLALLDRIVRLTSKPGDLVVDPFCGSATTGVAAIQNGRKFIGIDQEAEYLDRIAKHRLRDTDAHPDLFSA